MLSHNEAQELHGLIGKMIEYGCDEREMERAREIASLLVSDTDPDNQFDPNKELPELAPEVTGERYDQLRGYAEVWAYEHGWMIYEGITEDIQRWAEEDHSRTLTEDDCDTILNLLETATFITGTVNGE